VPDKKNAAKPAPAKAAAKAAPAKKLAAAPRRGEPVAKKAAPPAKPVKTAKAPPAKAAAAPKAAPPARAPAPAKAAKPEKAPAPAKSAAKATPPPKKAEPPKPEAKAKADPRPVKPAVKAAAPTKVNGKEPPPAKTAKAAAKPEPVKAEKPAKPAKPEKPPKPVKLAPVEAAFAKPKPAKPLAVAAGRAEPVSRVLATPAPKAAPKPLSAPKPAAVVEPELVGDLQAVPAFKAKAPDKKGMVLVGAIAGAFGVKGEVRLRAFTEKKDGVISYGPLYGEDGKVLLKPKSWRELKDGVAVAAPEVKSREQAEKMRGQKLFVPRSNLPATAEDEFYVVDLLGSKAEALDGTVLGDIVAVWNFGAGDIIEYRPPNGGPNVRVTFTKETVPHVDLAAKRVVIDPPAPEPVGK
jgi:16S rRNA processing protein RimM